MAKLGYLMLNDGVWKAKQILSSKWIEKSTKPYVHFNNKEGYGCQWWIKKYELGNVSIHSFAANGWVRRAANVDSSGKIKFTLYTATLTFELDKNEDVLIGYSKYRTKI